MSEYISNIVKFEPPGGTPLTMRAMEVKQAADIRALSSVLLDRLQFFRQAGISFEGARDLYQVLGYDRVLTYRKFRARYQRGGIAKRLVDVYPKATWRGGVELVEDPDANNKVPTEFEQSWIDLETKFGLWNVLQRVDTLAGLSTYAALLIGAPGELGDELPRGNGPDSILYFTPFSGGGGPGGDRLSRPMAMDADCSILDFDVNTESPRFGQPIVYQLKRTNLSAPMLQRPVHWSRIIHIAEGLLNDEVYGSPTLEPVWNLLDDLDKVTGGGAEAFWLRANQGLHWDVDKDMSLPAAKDNKEYLRQQAEDYSNQITRVIRTRGVNIKPLGSQVANFGPQADAILTQIAGSRGIPKRLLLGSEMGQLASGQDADNWNTQVMDRRTSYAGPRMVRPLVDRLIQYGYLPTPKQYAPKWPKIEDMTEDEKAGLAAKLAGVNKSYGSTVFTDDEIRKMTYGLEPATDTETDQFRAELAAKLAMVNKTQGLTIFTPAEIRKLTYGWQPLTSDEAVPIGAPEKISVKTPPPEGTVSGDVEAPGTQEDIEHPGGPTTAELLHVLEEAIRCNNTDVIDKLIGLDHGPHKFSSTQIMLPIKIANEVLAIGKMILEDDLDPTEGRELDPHITVKYGLHTQEFSDVMSVVDSFGPVTFIMGLTNYFEASDHDVVYVEVRSPDLMKLNALISDSLTVTDTHPTYQPHATVAYVKSGCGEKYAGISTVAGEVGIVYDVLFSAADGGMINVALDDQYTIDAPGDTEVIR